MKHVSRRLLPLVVLLTSACSRQPATRSEVAVPLPAHPAWAWGKRSVVSRFASVTEGGTPGLHLEVQRAIEAVLARKGWKHELEPSRAQFSVSYQIRSDFTDEYEFSAAYTKPLPGSFVILIQERQSGRVAWLGLYKKESWESVGGRLSIREVVDQMMDDLK